MIERSEYQTLEQLIQERKEREEEEATERQERERMFKEQARLIS